MKTSETDHTFTHIDPDTHRARVRVQKLLGWLAKPEWNGRTDREFIRALFEEYEKFSGQSILDPAE